MSTQWDGELFVDDDGSPETVWCTAGGRTALDAAIFADSIIGLDGDGFGVSLVYGVIEPAIDTEWRFRKGEHNDEMIAMWEIQLA